MTVILMVPGVPISSYRNSSLASEMFALRYTCTFYTNAGLNTALLALLVLLFPMFCRQAQSFCLQGTLPRIRSSTSPLPLAFSHSPHNMELSKQETTTLEKTTHVDLHPLSFNPLLFKSTKPILSKEQCHILSAWVRSQSQPELDFDALQDGL